MSKKSEDEVVRGCTDSKGMASCERLLKIATEVTMQQALEERDSVNLAAALEMVIDKRFLKEGPAAEAELRYLPTSLRGEDGTNCPAVCVLRACRKHRLRLSCVSYAKECSNPTG